MNQVILIGRLTVDPELRYLPNTGTAIARFSIAIDRSYKKEGAAVTDFIPVEAWGKSAEFCATYLGKGRLVAVNGSLHFDRYVDEQGVNRTYAKVSAKNVKALDSRKKKDSANVDSSNACNSGLDSNRFQAIDDDDLPF